MISRDEINKKYQRKKKETKVEFGLGFCLGPMILVSCFWVFENGMDDYKQHRPSPASMVIVSSVRSQ